MTTITTPTWGYTHSSTSTTPDTQVPNGAPATAGLGDGRRVRALALRRQAAQIAFARRHTPHSNNGDDERYPNRIGSFTKGLPHNERGEVEPSAYAALLRALATGRPGDFAAIPLGGQRLLVSPQAGLAFDLQGPDAHAVTMAPAPRLDSAEAAGEMVELYWMALVRDVPFTHYDCSTLTAEAAAELSSLSEFKGPKEAGKVTAATLFRGITPGDRIGPYISQFLLQPIHYGSLVFPQRQETVPAGSDHMLRFREWLAIQNGVAPAPEALDPTARYIRNLRDLAHYVHIDALYEAYLNAALILLSLGAPVDAGNPSVTARNQAGFATFGPPHLLSLVTEVATRALKAVWHQKWFVHRRLRPEAYGGLVHQELSGADNTPLHRTIRQAPVLERVRQSNLERGGEASYLLPLAFPEGSPLHPAYGAGHATVAGACATILKAWFDESTRLQGLRFRDGKPLVISVPDDTGTSLRRYEGSDAATLTVGGEIDKVAANVGIGRNGAGVHWRSDYLESIRLGEEVAIGLLEEQSLTYNEPNSFTLTTINGVQVRIAAGVAQRV